MAYDADATVPIRGRASYDDEPTAFIRAVGDTIGNDQTTEVDVAALRSEEERQHLAERTEHVRAMNAVVAQRIGRADQQLPHADNKANMLVGANVAAFTLLSGGITLLVAFKVLTDVRVLTAMLVGSAVFLQMGSLGLALFAARARLRPQPELESQDLYLRDIELEAEQIVRCTGKEVPPRDLHLAFILERILRKKYELANASLKALFLAPTALLAAVVVQMFL